jgi:hypothetical protein
VEHQLVGGTSARRRNISSSEEHQLVGGTSARVRRTVPAEPPSAVGIPTLTPGTGADAGRAP